MFVGAIDGRLIALDAGSGRLLWETVTVDQSKPYTITGAPRAANGLVYIGNGGAEYGVRGYVSAYEAKTGTLAWRFYTVPGDPSKGPDKARRIRSWRKAAATWNGQWWKVGGGGTVWDAIVYDPEFNQLIVGVGNGSPWNQQHRSPGGGDNLFLASIVALDAATGAYKWHYQTTPGETWDYTATQPIVLADLQIDGEGAESRDAGAEERFLLRRRSRERPPDLRASRSCRCLRPKDTPEGMPISWAYASTRRRGARSRIPRHDTVEAALVRPGPRARTTGTRCRTARRPAWSICRRRTCAFGYAHDPHSSPRGLRQHRRRHRPAARR